MMLYFMRYSSNFGLGLKALMVSMKHPTGLFFFIRLTIMKNKLIDKTIDQGIGCSKKKTLTQSNVSRTPSKL